MPTSPPGSWPTRFTVRVLLLAAACAVVIVATIYLAYPRLPAPTTEAQFRWATYGGGCLFHLAVGAFALVGVSLLQRSSRWVLTAVIIAAFGALLIGNMAEVRVATDLAKLVFAIAAGAAFSRAIERPAWLVPVCLLVPIADIWSVYARQGVTRHVIERANQDPRWVDWPTIVVPVPGFSYLNGGRLGITDVFFLALFVAVLVRWNMSPVRSTALLALGFVVTGFISLEWMSNAVPALPVLCVIFLLANPRPIWRDMRAAMGRPAR